MKLCGSVKCKHCKWLRRRGRNGLLHTCYDIQVSTISISVIEPDCFTVHVGGGCVFNSKRNHKAEQIDSQYKQINKQITMVGEDVRGSSGLISKNVKNIWLEG